MFLGKGRGVSVSVLGLSFFRKVVLPYHLRMLLRVFMLDNIFLVKLMFCTIYEKAHILNIKEKERQPIVLSFSNHILVIILKAKKVF